MDLRGLFDGLYDKLVLRDLFGKVVPGSVFLLCTFSGLLGIDTVDRFINKMTVALWVIAIGFAWLIAFALQFLGEACRVLKTHPPIQLTSNKQLTTDGEPKDSVTSNKPETTDEEPKDSVTSNKPETTDGRSFIFSRVHRWLVQMRKALTSVLSRVHEWLVQMRSDELRDRKLFHEKWANFHKYAEPHERVYAERLSVIKEACGNGAVSIALITLGLIISLFRGKGTSYPLLPFSGLAAGLAICLFCMHIEHNKRYGQFVENTNEFRKKEKRDALGENI